MDTEQKRVSKDIAIIVGIIAVVVIILSLLDGCNNNKVITKTKVSYITKHDTIRIVDVKYKPVPKVVIKHDTSYSHTTDTLFSCLDTLIYNDTIIADKGTVYLNEKVTRNMIAERMLSVDCYNTDTIIKIEKETIIRKAAFIKVIPGIFAWGNPRGVWGAGVNVQALLSDRYILGAGYDIKNQGIQGNFGIKISIK